MCVVAVLLVLAEPVADVVTGRRVFRRLGEAQGVVPTQDSDLNAFMGFLDQQIADAQRIRFAALEIHRGLKPPTDDFHAAFGGLDGVINRAEGTLAVHQRLEGGGYRAVFGALHEPWQVELAGGGLARGDRDGDRGWGHLQASDSGVFNWA
ncbi:hypothetical protein D3C71_1248580 [compost metagenome]